MNAARQPALAKWVRAHPIDGQFGAISTDALGQP